MRQHHMEQRTRKNRTKRQNKQTERNSSRGTSSTNESTELSLYSHEYTYAYRSLIKEVIEGFGRLHMSSNHISAYVTEHSGPTVYPDARQPLQQEMRPVEAIVNTSLDLSQPDFDAHTQLLYDLA